MVAVVTAITTLAAPTPARADCGPGPTTFNCTGTTNDFVGTNNLTITVQPGATVSAVANPDAILVRNNNTVVNNGTVSAPDFSTGINARSFNTITNNGSIIVGDDSIGILARRSFNTVTNNGSIVAGVDGIGIQASRFGNTIVNNGSIVVGEFGVGILVERVGNNVTNNGVIRVGDNGIGVSLNTNGSTGTNTFTNNGTIVATGSGSLSIFMLDTNANSRVINNGTIDGTLLLDGFNPTIINNGLITATASPVGVQHTVVGDYTQTSTGTLALRFTADVNNDYLSVFGQTTLAGTLKAVVMPGLYENVTVYSNTTSLNGAPIQLCGCVIGQFDRVISSSPFFTATPTYDLFNDEIDVTLTRIPFGSVPGATPNQKAVGASLEPGYSTSLTGNAATFYSYLLATTSISVLDLLSGEGSAAAQSAAINSGSLFNNAMLNQALFGDSNGAASLVYNPTPLAYAPAAKKRGYEAFAAIKPQQQVGFVPPGRWRVWTSGFGSTSSINGETLTGSASQSLRSYGGTLGLDYQLQADLLIGIAVGASESNFSVSDRATDGRLTGGHIGLYGIKTWGPYYLAATASYANFDNTITRTITGVGTTENTTGRFTSDQLGGRLELGWKQIYGRHTITPFVAVEPAVLWQRGYTETSTTVTGTPGILGLTYAAKTTTSLPTFVGVQFDTRYTFANGMLLTPYGRVSWVHEFNPNRQISASFITVPGANFTVDGARAARDAARLDAGARLALAPRASLFANVSGEFSDRTRSYTAMGGFRGFW